MFFLDPQIPVLTGRGYVPASCITKGTLLTTRHGDHVEVICSETVNLFDKSSRLSWYGSGEPFYIHSSSVLFSRVGSLNFYQPDTFTTKDEICTKFGFEPDSFCVAPFDGIDKAFNELIRLDVRKLRALYRRGDNITDKLGFLLYNAQINNIFGVSKFLLGLFKLSDEEKLRLVKNLDKEVLRYNDKYIIHFPNLYDAYNFVEFIGRFGLSASVFKFRASKISVYFGLSEMQAPRPQRYFKKISGISSSVCSRKWIVLSVAKGSTLVVAGIPMQICC